MLDAAEAKKLTKQSRSYSSLFWSFMGKIEHAVEAGQFSISKDLDWLQESSVLVVADELRSLGYKVEIVKGEDPKRAKVIERRWNFMLIKWGEE
jgi:hypothetical protein